MVSASSLLEQALQLDEAERAELADRLYESVTGVTAEWEAAWLPELDRRWAEHLANPDSAMPVEEFVERLRAAARTK